MDFLESLPTWALAVSIFLLRIIDVTVGTVRTIAVVHGRTAASVILGFFEVLVWVTVVAQVLQRAPSEPFVLLAYAGGFAAGNASGIFLERYLALGMVILRVITVQPGNDVTELFRDRAYRVYTFDGRGDRAPMTLIYVVVRRRGVRSLVNRALKIDPDLFFAVDPIRESNAILSTPLPQATGWRSELKIK